MAKQPSKPQSPPPSRPISWDIYRLAAKARPVGTVEATDEREAIEKAAEQFKQTATKLMAIRRR